MFILYVFPEWNRILGTDDMLKKQEGMDGAEEVDIVRHPLSRAVRSFGVTGGGDLRDILGGCRDVPDVKISCGSAGFLQNII